ASVCCTLIVPLQTRPPPTHTLFPYTTLFRSMLELYLEEPHHVDGETGDTGNGDPRRPVGREDLADSAMGHEMPLGGSTVARHHHAVGVPGGQDRGAFGHHRNRRPFGNAQLRGETE